MFKKKHSSHLATLIASIAVGSAAHAAPTAVEEIVVTAQFKQQNLQETPIAITAMSGEMIESRGQFSVEEIAAQAPNVSMTPGGAYAGNSLVAFIRGVGQIDFSPALEPGVGLYVDDVYYATLTGSVMDLLDLERVEVLRGPQGTLAGKNSIGGAVKLFSKRPDQDADGFVEISMGDLDAIKVRGASNFTLIEDKLWGRLAGVSNSRDGHVTTVDYGCSHPGSGFSNNNLGAGCKTGTDGGVDYTAGRLALRWLASQDLEINLSGSWVDDDSESTANTLLAAGPTTAPVIHPNGTIWDFNGIPPSLGTGATFIPDDPYLSYADYADPRTGLRIPRERTLESTDYTVNVDWDLTPDLQLQSITAYREYESRFSGDYDASPLPVALLHQTNTHEQFSQELRLNGAVGSFADWTVGAFYFQADTDHEGRIDLGYVGFDFIHGPDPVESNNWALFANTILHLTDRMDLALGLRYSEDKKDYTYRRTNPDGSSIQPCVGPPGTPGNPSNCLISSLNGVSSTFEDERVDYRGSLSYRLTDDLLAYGSISTGYKGGGVNPRPFYEVQAASFQPEEMTTYEIGMKADLLDNRMRVNGALFFNDYTDIQLAFSNCTAQFGPIFGVPCLMTTNAGDAEVKGAELEFDYLPFGGLSIDGSVSYIDFEFTEINPAASIAKSAVPPFTPEITWSLGIQYAFDTRMGTLTPRVDASYRDEVFTAPDNSELGTIDSYTLVNASIRLASLDESWVFAVEGRNLTDELYYTMKNDGVGSGGGTTFGSPGLPRTYMFTARRNF